MFKVVAINDSYSICVNAGWQEVKIGEKLLVLGDTGNNIGCDKGIIEKQHYIKSEIIVRAVFKNYCICEDQQAYQLKTLPFTIDPNELSCTEREIRLDDTIYMSPHPINEHNEIPLKQTVDANKALVRVCMEELSTTSFLAKVSTVIGVSNLIILLLIIYLNWM